MTSIKERLAAAKLPERSVQVCLRGDLAAEFDDLERQLKNVRETAAPRRIATKGEGAEIAEKMAALQEQMREEMLTVRVRALPAHDEKDKATGEVIKKGWQTLVREHPPRKDNEGDAALGCNLTSLMEEAIPLCVADPQFDAEDWERLNVVLSSADWDKLLNAVWDVNRSGANIPKSRLASLVMTEADADSK